MRQCSHGGGGRSRGRRGCWCCTRRGRSSSRRGSGGLWWGTSGGRRAETGSEHGDGGSGRSGGSSRSRDLRRPGRGSTGEQHKSGAAGGGRRRGTRRDRRAGGSRPWEIASGEDGGVLLNTKRDGDRRHAVATRQAHLRSDPDPALPPRAPGRRAHCRPHRWPPGCRLLLRLPPPWRESPRSPRERG